MSVEIKPFRLPGVTVDGVPVDFDTRKAVAILAYLAVEQKVSRETLTGLLWAESACVRARATLRRTLSSIRKGIGLEAIEADRYQVRLQKVDSDVSLFQTALAETRAAPIGPLTADVELCQGDLLKGFNRQAMVRASVGAYPDAIAAVPRWIELDSLYEPAHRLLMLLCAWAGTVPERCRLTASGRHEPGPPTGSDLIGRVGELSRLRELVGRSRDWLTATTSRDGRSQQQGLRSCGRAGCGRSNSPPAPGTDTTKRRSVISSPISTTAPARSSYRGRLRLGRCVCSPTWVLTTWSRSCGS